MKQLAWRLTSHGKTVTHHVAALTAAAASADLAIATRVLSTKALQHARTAWVQADEAQDALYSFHAQLFPIRQPPNDVYGAMDALLLKQWPDLPQDLQLIVDRYDPSQEKACLTKEVADRWQMAVRDHHAKTITRLVREQQQGEREMQAAACDYYSSHHMVTLKRARVSSPFECKGCNPSDVIRARSASGKSELQ
jgi:hypothetical protein